MSNTVGESLYVRKDVLYDRLKISLYPVATVYDFHMAREKCVYVKPGKSHNALLQEGAAPSRKISSSHILAEYHVSRKNDFSCRPV